MLLADVRRSISRCGLYTTQVTALSTDTCSLCRVICQGRATPVYPSVPFVTACRASSLPLQPAVMGPAELVAAATAAGQEHVFAEWDSLDTAQQQQLLEDVQGVNFAEIRRIFDASMAGAGTAQEAPEPLQGVTQTKDLTPEDRRRYRDIGFRLIAEGKLAVLTLAGGQGTRLGSPLPKGCFDIGLPSSKSLFQLQGERILALQRLAAAAATGQPNSARHQLRWYVMTSPATDAETQSFFRQHSFFGLQAGQVVFFRQGQLPCLTEEGRIIMSHPHRLATAPDGNGGIYMALHRCGVLADMADHGVECVDCFSVDNALIRPGDPLFVGYCWQSGAECGARVVAKAYPEERVGVFAQRGSRTEVVEYSELDPAEASAIDPATGSLRYNWSNVCMHFFRRSFLETVAERLREEGKYHVAKKRIPSKDGPVQGIKLELFIFDTFPMAPTTALLEVQRDEEFTPVKNAPGSATDSPDTAREAILALHKRWVEAAGGKVEVRDEAGVEVAPLVSYAGEGLEQVCTGRTFTDAHEPLLQGDSIL